MPNGAYLRYITAAALMCLNYHFGALCTQIPCHCAMKETCHYNGYCPNGCSPGWYGPGCQVGNLAFGKPADQSSTYNDGGLDNKAILAVDGNIPNDTSSRFCTHTTDKELNPWWYVTLAADKFFVIQNVTIFNRQGFNRQRLQNFYILYSNDTGSTPDLLTWSICSYEAGPPPDLLSSYKCTGLAIGQRVAIYFKERSSDNFLTLCEVYVDGYTHLECPESYTGPGCLLYSCNSVSCVQANGTCDVYGGCQFPVCPNNTHLPPDCWITLPDLSNSTLQATARCDSIQGSIGAPPFSNLNATSLTLDLSLSDSNATSTKMAVSPSSGTVAFNVSTLPGQKYLLKMTPKACLPHNESHCAFGPSTGAAMVETGMRKLELSHNESCVSANVTSSNIDCEVPETVSVSCVATSAVNHLHSNVSRIICGLLPDISYNCTVEAVVSANVSLSYTIPVMIVPDAVPGATATAPLGNSTQAIAGGIAGGAALVVIVVVVAILVFRRGKAGPKSLDGRVKNPSMIASPVDGASFNSYSDTGDQTYDNMAGMSLSQFKAYVTDGISITTRFSELVVRGSQPCLAGSDPAHKSKNRFQNIIPYDANRVALEGHEDNYINASYINGFVKPKLYIATQGPSLRTIEDFWQMVWQEKSSIIVMLTDYIEHAKKKCEKYFPMSGSAVCPLTVSVSSVSKYDTHTITTLVLHHESEMRLVSHFHFLSWPDQSVPEHSALMLLFHHKIRAAMKDPKHQNGPLVVHCSAGVGRTGVFIACDLLEQRYIAQGRVDVDSCVMQLRDQRMQMVQTKDQYVFVHKAVLYSMMTSHYIFDSAHLATRVGKVSQESQALSQEWQVLQDYLPRYDARHFAAATHPDNVSKNRDSRILASDLKRPILASRNGKSQGYINAVYCNGCYSQKGFLVTQLPLRYTIADFWQMVYEANASCIVLVHELPEDKDCPQYWPDPGESVRAGSFLVTNKTPARISSPVTHEFGLTVEPVTCDDSQVGMLSLKLFVLKTWSWSAEVPADHELFLQVASTLKTHCKDTVDRPVVVQCKDGASHSGLFVSALNSLYRLVECNEVQVFHSVDLIRISRSQFVTGQNQYRFIYEVLHHYCESAHIYANA